MHDGSQRTRHRHRLLVSRVLLILLAVAGCAVSGVLAVMATPNVDASEVFGTEICATTDTISCTHVLRSQWGKIGPLTAAHLGFAYFAALGIWFWLIGIPNSAGWRWHRLPLLVGCAGLCASIYYTYVMAAHLKLWCTWCLGAHVINVAMFALIFFVRPRLSNLDQAAGVRPYPSSARGFAVLLGTAAALLMLGTAVTGFVLSSLVEQCRLRLLDATNNASFVQMKTGQSPRHDIRIRFDDLVVGSREAPNVLVSFSDFECPHCSDLFRSAKSLTDRFPGRLQLAFKHFPVSRTCNKNVQHDLHHFACEAALAAEAARVAGTPSQHYEYCRLLYHNAKRLDERPYEAFAREVGIDVQKFQNARIGGAGVERIAEDVALGHNLGVAGSGVVFLNGQRMPNWRVTTTGIPPKIDVDRTIAMWEQILGVGALTSRNETEDGPEPSTVSPSPESPGTNQP
ncbi:MAG: thioredoxin domain-containing protein [Planctomycetota bacterium]|nr:thioredoxin domain-containing protein [Planctomycetota bacterium]